MLSFSQFLVLNEAKYPNWLRVGVAVMVMKMRKLTSEIESEKDPVKQNALIAQQNRLLSYINGLGIGVGTEDNALLQRMRKGIR